MADPPAPPVGHDRAASGGVVISPSSLGVVAGALSWIGLPFGLGAAAAAAKQTAAGIDGTAVPVRSAPTSAPAKTQFARAPTRTPGTVRQSGGGAALTAANPSSAAASSTPTAALDSAAPSALHSRRNSTGNAADHPAMPSCVRTESAPLVVNGGSPTAASASVVATRPATMNRHAQAMDCVAAVPVPAAAPAPLSESMPSPAAVPLCGASKPDSSGFSSRHRTTPPRDALSSDSDLEGAPRHASSLDALHAHPRALAAHFRRPLPPHRIQFSPPSSPTPDEQATAAAAASHPVAAAATSASRPYSHSSADALEDEDGSQQQRLFKLLPAPSSPADALPTGSPEVGAATMPDAQWVQTNTLAAAQTAAPSQPLAGAQLPPADLFHSLHSTTAAPSAEPCRPPLHQSHSSHQLEMHQQLLQANANARAVTAAAEAPYAPAPAPAASAAADPSLAMAHASSAPNLPALAALPSVAAAMPSMPSVPDLSSYSSAHFEEAQAQAAAEAAAAAASAEATSASSASPAESILPGFFGFGSSSRANSGHATSASPTLAHVRSLSSSENLAAGLASATVSATGAAEPAAPPRNIKLLNFQRVLAADVLDLGALKRLSWSGIPPQLRGQAWKLMLGYLPVHLARRPTILAKRREEYASYLVDHYYCGMRSEEYYAACEAASLALGSPSGAGQAPLPSPVPRSEGDHEILKQIQQDVPRTSPGIVWFKVPAVQLALERVLYIFAVRHPASGYVQGINDLVTPFMTVFLLESYGLDILAASTPAEAQALLASSPLATGADSWRTVEADCYWCLSALIDSIQDHYTFAQPGIQKMIYRLQELILRIDGNTSATVASATAGAVGAGGITGTALAAAGSSGPHIGLHAHLSRENVQFLHFAFRWMTCLLMRELRLPLILRLWDSYLADESLAGGFREMHIYVCAALVMRFKEDIKHREFQQIIQFMQKLPTGQKQQAQTHR